MVGCGILTVTVSACESTEQESAKLGREGQLTGGSDALELGALNHGAHVSDVTLVSSGGRMAVAARITSSAKAPQANLPVLVSVTGAGGKVLYSNEASGLEASLQHLGGLSAHRSVWWVDDQVLTSQRTTGVRVRVGTGTSAPAAAARRLQTSSVHTHLQGGATVLSGELVNHSARAQSQVPVFAVALRRGHVVAAGRVVVASLAAHAGASAAFQMFLVGDANGARFELSAVPASR